MKKIVFSVLGIVIVGVAAWALWLRNPSQEVAQPTPTAAVAATPTIAPTPTPAAQSGATSFTFAQVAAHNSAKSCYTLIRGSVYDVTTYITQHPGGVQKILGICGKDGTSAFVDQHGGQSQQESLLATFKIGVLAQ